MAILGAEGPGKSGDNLLDFVERYGVQLLWHPSLSLESPHWLLGLVDRIAADEQPLTVLCVEGSIINAPDGTGLFDTIEGQPKRDLIARLCDHADYVVAMGSCAAYGGIPAAPPNPSESTGLQFAKGTAGALLAPEWRSRAGLPVVNLAGCPVDAATMLTTLGMLLEGRTPQLNRHGQPPTVSGCLANPDERKCLTAEKVGYACYGCVGAKFPVSRPLFQHRPLQVR